jgi:hypothetical protein
VLCTAGLLGALTAVAGCSAPSDSSGSASVAQTALPDDTDDTTFVSASPESTAKYGVAYWGETPDPDHDATTVVGYGANQQPIVNLRYDIDHDFVLDLTGPGIDEHARFPMTADPSVPPAAPASASGVTDAAMDLYNQIAADAERAADEPDDQGAPAATDVGLVAHAIHPETTVVNPTYSKDLLNKCWAEIVPCRQQTRSLVKNLNKLLLNPKSCSGAWKLLSDCKLMNQSCQHLQDAAVSSNGASCGAGVSQQRDAVKSNRSTCETKRTSCLSQGTSPPAPVKSGSCTPSQFTQCA